MHLPQRLELDDRACDPVVGLDDLLTLLGRHEILVGLGRGRGRVKVRVRGRGRVRVWVWVRVRVRVRARARARARVSNPNQAARRACRAHCASARAGAPG